MIFECLSSGMFGSNCYVLGDNGEGVIIDAGASCEDIVSVISKNKLSIKYIFLTHGHIDHICSIDRLKNETGATVLIHNLDAEALENPRINLSVAISKESIFKKADILFNDNDIFETTGLKYTILHTPGHTPGGVCIIVNDMVFTGDTLFKMTVGRTDLPNCDHSLLIQSIKTKLMTLNKEYKIYPGHGDSSTIGYEKSKNPYIR